jgi:membrane protease YdiL (CAAX protease family)
MEKNELKPMGWFESSLYFGVPALVLIICFHWLRPMLENLGLLPFYAYLISLGIPLVLALIASLVVLKLEGYSLIWADIKIRFRLNRMDGKTWLLSIGLYLAAGVFSLMILSPISALLIQNGVIPLPDNIPLFLDPRNQANAALTMDQAVGGLSGNFLPAISLFIVLVFNILGEEFWWRGVVLPRQELAFGKWTWLVHGVMWDLFHVFKWWDLLGLLPITLAIAFVCSRKKNTNPGILMHSLTNGMGLIPFIIGALQ